MADNKTNTQQNTAQRLSRAEIIKRNTENKKRVIDNNVNAAVFVSDSKAGTQIFSSLRMLDSIDSAIRRVWGVNIQTSEIDKWFAGIKDIQAKLAELQTLGIDLLVEANSPRDISNRILRNTVADKIKAKAQAEKAKGAETSSQTNDDEAAAKKTTTTKKKAS